MGYHERRRVFKAGLVSFDGAAISCTVRSLSTSGALLEIGGLAGIPKRFTLVIAADEFRRACRVIWMTEKRLGVAFEPI
ncbi:MAG: PilZ domain-containing protein [Pseudomonadota bacterium]